MSLIIAVVFALFMILLVNELLKKLSPRLALTQAELMFVYLMQTVSVGISGIGMMQFLNTMLGNLFYYSTTENQWKQKFLPYIRPWLMPNPNVLHDYYYGQSRFLTAPHLMGWALPIAVWTVFILVLLGVMLCINVIVRRQWMDHERLTFPITILPLELTRNTTGTSWLNNRMMWIGFTIPVVLESLASLNYLYPSVPFVPIKPSDPRLDLSHLFTQPPWSGIGYFTLSFYPMVIGLTYFFSLDVSFSCWFFYLMTKAENVIATAWGYHAPGAGLAASRMPYLGEQSAGAFIGLAVFSLFHFRKYLADVFRSAFRRNPPFNDENEPMPYRWAIIGMVAGLTALCTFGVLIGMTWYVPIVFFLIYFIFAMTFTRIRAEAGLAWGYGPDMTPHQLMIAGEGVRGFNTSTLVGLTFFQWFDLDFRCMAMPNQIEAMKIAENVHLNNRHVAIAIIVATLVGSLASWWAVLTCYYQYGAATARVNSWRTSMGSVPWQTLQNWLNNPTRPDFPRLEAVFVGLVIIAILMFCRTQFTWWPFHPIGYALAGTSTMPWLWCATFVGWLIKLLIIRYGGMSGYKKYIPFFVGLILGDYITGGVWAIYGSIMGVTTYRVFPI